MGYAQMHQRGHGIHLRQYSRAFIVENNGKRAAFVAVDGAMISHPIKRDVNNIIIPTWFIFYLLDYLHIINIRFNALRATFYI